jgi:hypothetical protein
MFLNGTSPSVRGGGWSVTRPEQNSNLLLVFAVLTNILIRDTLHYIYLELNDLLRVGV